MPILGILGRICRRAAARLALAAMMRPAVSCNALLNFLGGTAKGRGKMFPQIRKGKVIATRTANQDVITTRQTIFRQNIVDKRPHPAFHPVACDGVPDFFADGIANAQLVIPVIAFANEKDKARHRKAKAAISGKKFASFC
jgi:hypothetical protein